MKRVIICFVALILVAGCAAIKVNNDAGLVALKIAAWEVGYMGYEYAPEEFVKAAEASEVAIALIGDEKMTAKEALALIIYEVGDAVGENERLRHKARLLLGLISVDVKEVEGTYEPIMALESAKWIKEILPDFAEGIRSAEKVAELKAEGV